MDAKKLSQQDGFISGLPVKVKGVLLFVVG